MSRKRRDRKGWFVLADSPDWACPRKIATCGSGAVARQIAAALNREPAEAGKRPLYWAELMDTSSVLDTERSES